MDLIKGRSILLLLVALVAISGCGTQSKVKIPPAGPTTAKVSGPLGGLSIYISDEDGNRIIQVNQAKQILWTATVPAPDDIAPTPQGTIIVNSDVHQQVFEVSAKTGKIGWTYGQFDHQGGGPGQLYIPEDSFGMPGNLVDITDPGNERIIQVDKASGGITWHYGHTGVQGTLPGYLFATNDGVPLRNGDVLITDAGNRPKVIPKILDVNRAGSIVWQTPIALAYPSDTMPVGGGKYVAADWITGGSIDVFNSKGQISWSYGPKSGPGMLDHPSSAEMLPNGNFLVSDDYNKRVIVIDPKKNQIVWQYGTTGVSGTGPNQLAGPTDAKAAGELLPPYVSAMGAAR